MKYFIKTFGCRLNFSESDILSQKLQNYYQPSKESEADFIIIRACSVTAGAEQGVRQAIRKYKRKNKYVFVIGCFIEKIKEANGYFKSEAKLIEYLQYQICRGYDRFGIKNNLNDFIKNRTRAFIKIQNGCNFNCAFCITHILRGKSSYVNEEEIMQNIQNKLKLGVKEIVLTGVNILLYKNLSKLIQKILKINNIKRIRFGSIDPRLVSQDFINLFKDNRLMPHLHLSLQSGSKKVLDNMNRKNANKNIFNIIKKLRRINPLFEFSADIIVGFPTETEKDFKKTLDFIKNIPLSKIHYFPYSPRPKTPAESLKQLSTNNISKRLAKIKQLDIILQSQAKKRILNKKILVLFENKKDIFYYGYTPNFIRIKKKSKKNLTNKIEDIIIKKSNLI